MGSQDGPTVVVGTFDISEQGDGSSSDFTPIVSAAQCSFGVANAGGGGEAVDLRQHISESFSWLPGINEITNSTGQHPEEASGRGQTNPERATSTLPADASLESLQLPVISDSLSTLSENLKRLRHEFNENVRIHGNNPPSLDGEIAAEELHAVLPTPAVLGEVIQSTRQMHTEQVGECLVQLARQLGDQTNVTDPMGRLRMQSNAALKSGALLRSLAAFLLELGRTTMTLQLGTSFGTTPMGACTSFSVGSGLCPRNIDVSIRTGVDQREASGGEQPAVELAASDGGVSNHQANPLQPITVVSQHLNGVANGSFVQGAHAENGATQPYSNVEMIQGRGASSRHPAGPSSSPTLSRQGFLHHTCTFLVDFSDLFFRNFFLSHARTDFLMPM